MGSKEEKTPSGTNTGSNDSGKKNEDKKDDDKKDEVEVMDVTLKVWGPQEEQTLLAQMCESFAAVHPEYNIKFEYGVVAEGDSANELQKDPAAGADVFAFASDQTANLVNAGILYPITLNADAVKAANSESSIPQMGNYWAPAEAFGIEILNGTVTKTNVQEKLDAFVISILSTIR